MANKKNTDNAAMDSVDASPVKSFFVDMLTRDIELMDAVLDLLDNCVDGIMRQKKRSGDKPYVGYRADITFDTNHFKIEDNCGGIPKVLSDYAFRMGRSDDKQDVGIKTVGTYGIGMKRALFKIGKDSRVLTQCNKDSYSVKISPEWLKNEDMWSLPRRIEKPSNKQDGTIVEIKNLNENISKAFKNEDSFQADFIKVVSRHYALIIQKGFKVTINEIAVPARPVQLLFENYDKPTDESDKIRPFIYTATIGEVDVILAVGFRYPPPSDEELDQDRHGKQFKTEDAGITVICNDRVVLSCDKSILTGWGEAGVPNYHTQFIAIAGFVEFSSVNARALPMTTTKRGVDGNSVIYLTAKNKLREGIKKFCDYTNNWKGKEKESRDQLRSATLVDVKEISSVIGYLSFNPSPKGGKQYNKPLPKPKQIINDVRISYIKKKKDVRKLAEYLFNIEDVKPSEVGEKCFDIMLKEVEK